MMARKRSASHRREQAEVLADRGEDGVDAVADAAFEIVAVHAVLGLDVADDGLDSRTTLHLAPDGSRDAADLPRDPDPEPVREGVAAVPCVPASRAGDIGFVVTEDADLDRTAMQTMLRDFLREAARAQIAVVY